MVDNSGSGSGAAPYETNNFRSAVITEPNLMPPMGIGGTFGGSGAMGDSVLRTPYAGNVRALAPPPLPQVPYQSTIGSAGGLGGSFNGGYGGGFGNTFGSGYGGFGSGFGGLGGGYGGMGGYGGGYGGYGGGMYNRFGGGGTNPMDPETRFIQLAEASSRPAFQSIESLVSAIGNIAAMLDSTFFALTSSFRAILGVAANFGRLRGVFAQFWQTFAVFRGLTWIYKKILYWLRLSNLDPSSQSFKKAFAEAVNETSTKSGAPTLPRKGQSPWPVLAFLSFIFTAPYLIMKLLGTVTNTAQEEARDPAKWTQPIETVALYDFQARNPTELSVRCGERLLIAPKEIQNTLGLLNTGWGLASADGKLSGIIPINYVKSPQQMREERQQLQEALKQDPQSLLASENPQPELMNLSSAAFPTPPSGAVPDFDIASHQPLSPPPTIDAALNNGFV